MWYNVWRAYGNCLLGLSGPYIWQHCHLHQPLLSFARLKRVELKIDVNRHEPTILVRPCMLLLSTQWCLASSRLALWSSCLAALGPQWRLNPCFSEPFWAFALCFFHHFSITICHHTPWAMSPGSALKAGTKLLNPSPNLSNLHHKCTVSVSFCQAANPKGRWQLASWTTPARRPCSTRHLAAALVR